MPKGKNPSGLGSFLETGLGTFSRLWPMPGAGSLPFSGGGGGGFNNMGLGNLTGSYKF
jgi:hypothetical protein